MTDIYSEFAIVAFSMAVLYGIFYLVINRFFEGDTKVWFLIIGGFVSLALALMYIPLRMILTPSKDAQMYQGKCSCGCSVCECPYGCKCGCADGQPGDFYNNQARVCTSCKGSEDVGTNYPAIPSNYPTVSSPTLPYTHPLGTGLPQHVYYPVV